MSRSDEKKAEASVQAYEATNDIYSLDDIPGLDRVYHAKARLLNNAIQEIGMGKYQVRAPNSAYRRTLLICCPVVALLRHRFRVVRRQSVACKYAPTSQPRAKLTRHRSSLA